LPKKAPAWRDFDLASVFNPYKIIGENRTKHHPARSVELHHLELLVDAAIARRSGSRPARRREIGDILPDVCRYAEEAFAKNLPEGEDFGFMPKPFTLKQLIEAVKANMG
jgi:hypothetical protein